jgi:hypothetical protein
MEGKMNAYQQSTNDWQEFIVKANSKGYLDGLADLRNGRTPEHSQTAYKFPRHASIEIQHAYNSGYYGAKSSDVLETRTAALRQIMSICQEERLPCAQIFEIAEEALADTP